MANNNNVVISITGVNNTGPAFAGVRSSAQSAVSSIEKSFSTIGNSFKTVGKKMTTAITLPVAGALAKGISEYSKVEQTFAKVTAFAGIAGEDLQDLKEKAEEFAHAGVASAQDVGAAFVAMGQAGWGKKQMLSGIDAMNKFAKVTGQSMEDMTPVITKTIGAFGLTASEIGYYTDVLAAAAAAGNAEVADMSEAFNNLASTCAQSGSDVRDVAAALSILSDRSLVGSTAGTYLSRMLNNLNSPTSKQAKAMKKYGIEAKDAKGNIRSLKDVMTDLRYELKSLSQAEKASAINEMFDDRAAKAVSAIVTASESDFNKYLSTVYSASDGIGSVTEMYNTMVNTLSEKVKKLGITWSTVLRKAAESIIPSLSKMVDFFQKLGEKISSLSPKTLDMIVKFSLIAAAVGPVVWMFGSFITSVLAIVKGVTAFAGAVKFLSTTFSLLRIAMIGASSTPWGLIISGIGAAVIGLGILIYKNWDKIKECLSTAFNWVKEKWDAFISWISPSVKGLAQKLGIEEELNVVANTIKGFKWYDWIIPTGKIKIFDGLLKHFNNGTGIVEIAKKVGQKIADAWNGMTDVFGKVVDNIVNFFVEKFNLVKEIISIAEEIKYKIQLVFTGIFAVIYTAAKNKIKDLIKLFKDVASPIVKAVSKIVKPIVNIFKKIFTTFKNIVGKIVSQAKTIINNVKNLFSKGMSFVVGKITGIFEKIRKVYNSLQTFYFKIMNFIRPVLDVVNSFKKGFQSVMEKVVDVFQEIYNHFTSFMEKFKAFTSDVKSVFVSFINVIITGINHLIAGLNKLHITTPAVPELNIPAINLGFNIPEIPTLPELNIGTSEVLRDGLAVIHKGEAVVPAEVNPFTAKNKDLIVKNKSNVITVKVVVEDNREDAIVPVNIDGRKVADLLMKHTRNAVAVRGC